ncbi:MAG: histidine triad nucleotide-binding protein [Alphaproteobacteria bacterium]|nr:histidine triad nucleotide-binding protein [Alphaproteobacteria bacterium]
MEYNSNNAFAKILRGEIPAQKIYEDEFAMAFYDIAPKAKIHALVISKAMVVDFEDFVEHSNATEIEGYMRAIVRTAEKLGLIEGGYRLVFNSGKNSGQEVPHLHAHILGGEPLSTHL